MTDCLEAPACQFPSEPEDPADGEPITDVHLLRWKLWGNQVMGCATSDRNYWHGERKCVRKLEEAGLVR